MLEVFGFFDYLFFAFFLISLTTFAFSKTSKLAVFFYYYLSLGIILFFAVYRISDSFTGQGFDPSVIYHIKYGMKDAVVASRSLVLSAALGLFIGFTVLQLFTHFKVKIIFRNSILSFTILFLTFVLNPALLSLYQFLKTDIVHSLETKSNFSDLYHKPYIKRNGYDRKNVVFIYGESLEWNFFDEAIFPGLMPGLSQHLKKSTYFTNVRQMPYTGWTIAGITASQCGIPLLFSSHGNSMSGMDQFLPSAVCLSDLLHREGYRMLFYGGASLEFAGKGKFFRTHQFDEIIGKRALLASLGEYADQSPWGITDGDLLRVAFERFLELSSGDEPYGLFLLTLDTHLDGHLSQGCGGVEYRDGKNALLNAVHCSDKTISKFIEDIKQSPYASETVIVVASDHLAMNNSVIEALTGKKRSNLFMIIDPQTDSARKIESIGTPFDVGPTVLSFLGFDSKIALGRDLLQTSLSEKKFSEMYSGVSSWKADILPFWNFPTIKKVIKVDPEDKKVVINDREFEYPALVQWDKDWKTNIRFDFGRSNYNQSLLHYVRALKNDDKFLWVDTCQRIFFERAGRQSDDFCVAIGKGKESFLRKKIKNAMTFTRDDLFLYTADTTEFIPLRVAHAGGGIKKQTYTNSLEALNDNIQKGFRYFEIDLSFTRDGRLVCLHDWDESFTRSFGFKVEKHPTLDEFEQIVKKSSSFENCTLDSLANWLEENPSAFIITDIKEHNLEGLKMISKKIPEFRKKIIPQIYDPKNFDRVKALGYKRIIWTLYRYQGTQQDVLAWVDRFDGPFAVTMPAYEAGGELQHRLKKKNIPTYVHTINTVEEKETYCNEYGVSEIYTDFLIPEL